MSEDSYLIADPDMSSSKGWQHYIGTDNGEKLMTTRFVFDLGDKEIKRADAFYEGEWCRLTWEDIEDLEDSLLGGNPEAIDDPEKYGLAPSQELPDWAAPEAPTP